MDASFLLSPRFTPSPQNFSKKEKEAHQYCFLIVFYHGIKGFVIPTKSCVKIGTAKIFCYNKMFSSINKTFGC